MKSLLGMIGALVLVAQAACAQTDAGAVTNSIASRSEAVASAERTDRIRNDCIQGRRAICGKVIKILPEGLVVDSGYTGLLKPPFNQSWVVSGTASVTRDAKAMELDEPGAACVGVVFLTHTPRRPDVKLYDFVVIQAYPVGQHTYTSVPGVEKTVRKFSAGLDTAIKMRLESGEESSEFQGSSVQSENSKLKTANSRLSMPDQADGSLPRLLSQTGAFKDVRKLSPSDELIPYDLNVSFWSDGAEKARWVSVRGDGKIELSPDGEWKFPRGTVFVKHFELGTDETKPEVKRRLETRLLVCDATGGVYGVTYKWRADESDAELLSSNLTENISIKTATGTRTQAWYFPSREDCLTCHTRLAGGVLGVKTRQLNRDFIYPRGSDALSPGVRENQLYAWSRLGLFDRKLGDAEIAGFDKLAMRDDATRSLEDRARSYLDANCANCHRPGGTVAEFDARYTTPLAKQNLISAPVLIDEGIDGARAIAPRDIWRSIVFQRLTRFDGARMPPLAHSELDQRGIELLRQWIESLPGAPVLPPPQISPRGGQFARPVAVALKSDTGATIRYTLDGSVPTASDPIYEKPIELSGPTILRAKAFKPGYTKSITAQEIFNFGE